jgi:hypothetical protein
MMRYDQVIGFLVILLQALNLEVLTGDFLNFSCDFLTTGVW